MNHDEATDQARKVLGDRLNAWGVPEPYRKANAYIEGLTGQGWRYVSPVPMPPKSSEACDLCGRHELSCICDVPVADGSHEQPDRPRGFRRDAAVPPTPAYLEAKAALRESLPNRKTEPTYTPAPRLREPEPAGGPAGDDERRSA